MLNPKTFLKDFIVGPIYNFHQNYVGKYARHTYCKKIANFIFNRSKETALIMLIFNSISIVSSHLSQIGGLKKSKRENKDYLINQERQELGLDLLLTIIPPFILNNFLMKKLDSGEWTTKSARTYLTDRIAPTVGASRNELYNTSHIKPFKENVKDSVEEFITTIKKSGKLPNFINDKIPMPVKKFVDKVPMVSMEDITTDFDLIKKGQFKQFYNGKAYDEINGQRNGMLILATIGYTVIASNIIMPILKNKLANHSYKKQLERMGETPESIKRKKRFEFYNSTPIKIEEHSVFNTFSDNKTASAGNYTKNQQNNIFKNFNKYTSQSNDLRI